MDYLKHYRDKLKSKLSKSRTRPSKKLCQIHHQNKNFVYLVYTTVQEIIEEKKDFAGLFTSREDAEKIAKCLNKIFKNINDPMYKLDSEYNVQLYVNGHNDGYFPVHFDNVPGKRLYSVQGYYYTKKHYSGIIEVIQSIVNTLEEARKQKKEIEEDIGTGTKVHIKKYYLNDVMPTMNLDDYDIEKHKENMKIITDELQKYPQRKKMKDVLENIELLKYAPPSRVLPKGGLEYQEMVNDPEFRKRWSKYDKKFKD